MRFQVINIILIYIAWLYWLRNKANDGTSPLLSSTLQFAIVVDCAIITTTLSSLLLIVCSDGILNDEHFAPHVSASLSQIPFNHLCHLLSSPFPIPILILSMLSYHILSYHILSYLIFSFSPVCRRSIAACCTGSVSQPLCHRPRAPSLLTRYSQALCRDCHTG